MNVYWILLLLLTTVFVVFFLIIRHYYHERLVSEINRAQRSERVKTVFMANVSHALRTPINTIIYDSKKLMEHDDITRQQIQSMATEINENANQLMYFISQLLELSNFENSMATFTQIEVNLAELMASYRREAQRDAGTDVTVVVRSQLSPHCKATLDTNLMYQLMIHLLRNANAHTSDGSITIEYGYEDKGLEITVTDTGDGNIKELQNDFSDLIQKGDSLTFFNKDSGLGLSICKSIIDSLKGEITLTSESGKGCKVSVWIPCKMRDMKKGITAR